MFFSIVFPVYAKPNFLETIKNYTDFLKKKGLHFEIIVAADCLPKESELKLKEALPNAILDLSVTRRGKGKAIRAAFTKASGEAIGFLDCDGSIPAEDVMHVMASLKDNAAAIAIRAASSKRAYHRSALSLAFNQYTNLLLNLHMPDTQCGLKFFRRDALMSILSSLKIDGFAFDTEILYKLRGKKIALVPINWSEQSKTTLNPLAIFRMAEDVARIRFF